LPSPRLETPLGLAVAFDVLLADLFADGLLAGLHVLVEADALLGNGALLDDLLCREILVEISDGLGGWSRCQMRRVRWRLRQRIASVLVLASARLRAM
jgi:hypothetical protein